MTDRLIARQSLGDVARPLLRLMLQASQCPESQWHGMLADVHPELPALYRRADARIDLGHFMVTGERLMQTSSVGRNLGLAMARHLRDTDLGLAGQIARTAPTLGEALEKFMRYSALMTRCYLIQPRLLPGSPACLRFQAPSLPQHHQFINDAVLAICARLITQLSGRADALRAATLTSTNAWQCEAMAEHLGVTVMPSPQFSSLLLHANALTWPVVTAEPALHADLCRLADTQLQALQQDETLSLRLRQWLGTRLQGQTPTLEEAAEAMGMAAWTLRRRLQTEGVSYRDLLDHMRHQLSLNQLTDSRISLGEVAFALGFSGSGAFQRAFKRWTGETPGRYRELIRQQRTATS